MPVQMSVFVAHAFTPGDLADLRAAIDSALSDSGIRAIYADAGFVDGQILDGKIQIQIERSDFCLCEISDHSRASVFVEYGIAKGRGKPCVLLLRSGSRPPSDLEGYDRIEYASYAELAGKLRAHIPMIRELTARAGYAHHRVALICSTTAEIEADAAKTESLTRFYRHLFAEFERVPLAINTCGAEPLRRAFLGAYAEKLLVWSAEQMRSFQPKVRWYWHRTARHGFGYQPSCFESWQSADRESRTIDEALGSSAIVAFTGRTGTQEQVTRLLGYHRTKTHGLDLHKRPLILLAWFGGSVAELLREKSHELAWLLNSYAFLEPQREFSDWETEGRSVELARKFVTGVQHVLETLVNTELSKL